MIGFLPKLLVEARLKLMKFLLKRAVFLVVFVFFIPFSSFVAAEEYPGSPYINLKDTEVGSIVHLPTGVKINSNQLMDTLSDSKVIYVGETHDNLEAHRVQLEIIRALNEKFPGRVAVGMEMFRRSAQPQLDLWQSGRLSDRKFKSLFYEHWGTNYRIYKTIFDYISKNRLPIIGLKSNKETQKKFREKGYPERSSDGSFPEIDLDDPFHKVYSASVFGGHEKELLKNSKPYKMLLLWEETMAETVANFLREERFNGWKLVVLAGGFHVQYGFGIPKRAFRRIPHSYSIVLPTVTYIPPELKDREMSYDSVSVPLYSADFAWKVDYKVLPEGKIKLGVFLEETKKGPKIKSVGENSNAERAGILANDILIEMSGELIAGVEDLKEILQTKKSGDIVTVKFIRNSVQMILEMELLE
jgi:uncharacterized iron-regulated protein